MNGALAKILLSQLGISSEDAEKMMAEMKNVPATMQAFIAEHTAHMDRIERMCTALLIHQGVEVPEPIQPMRLTHVQSTEN